MTLQRNFNKVKTALAEKLRELPPILGEEAVNFFKLQFEQQAFSGYSQQVWAQRINPTKWGKPDKGQLCERCQRYPADGGKSKS